jgi:hypothetical protein
MRKSLKALAVVAALATMGTARAEAQFTWSGCGGVGSFPPGGFNTCASVNIFVSGTNELTMVVQNWGTYNPATNSFCTPFCGSSIFTQLGILNGSFGSGALTGLNSFACVNDPTCSWEFDTSLNGLPGYAGGARYTGSGGNVNSGLNAPASSGAGQYRQVTLVFATNPVIDLSQATFGLHGQAGPNNCSTKLFVTNDNGTYTFNSTTSQSQTTCVTSTNTPIPEPMSMVLLATGLVAMGGAGLIRRRRKV